MDGEGAGKFCRSGSAHFDGQHRRGRHTILLGVSFLSHKSLSSLSIPCQRIGTSSIVFEWVDCLCLTLLCRPIYQPFSTKTAPFLRIADAIVIERWRNPAKMTFYSAKAGPAASSCVVGGGEKGCLIGSSWIIGMGFGSP